MDFSIVQILLVGAVAFIAGIDQFSFLESLYQPIVLGPIIGAILKDPATGLAVGASYQLISIGSMPIGGAQPPNVIIGGVMATVFAIGGKGSAGMATDAAIGLAIPFSLLGQYAVTLTFTITSGLMAWADKSAKEANPGGIVKLNLVAMGIVGALFAIICMAGLVAGAKLGEALQSVSYQFSWVMAGLDAAGGMMKYVGFAMLMKIMLSNDLWGFFLAGFAGSIMVGKTGYALVILTFIGLAIALYDYQVSTRMKHVDVNSGGGFEDGI